MAANHYDANQPLNHYLYLLPFQDGEMFKVGITSNNSFSRIIDHQRAININPKTSMLIKADKETVKKLEAEILKQFSKFSMTNEALSRYGLFPGCREVLSIGCFEQVLNLIQGKNQDSELNMEITKGLSIPKLYTDNNVHEAGKSFDKSIFRDLDPSYLLEQLIIVLGCEQVTRVNYGFKKTKKDFSVQYVIEAEEGFSNDFFDGTFEDRHGFHYGNLFIGHSLSTGQKLRSGGTYLRGEFNLEELKKEANTEDYEAVIQTINQFLDLMVNHIKRDENFKVLKLYRTKYSEVFPFKSYGLWQEIRIGKSLTWGDSCLW